MKLTVHYDNPREWRRLLETIETGVDTFRERPLPDLEKMADEGYQPPPARVDWVEWYRSAMRLR